MSMGLVQFSPKDLPYVCNKRSVDDTAVVYHGKKLYWMVSKNFRLTKKAFCDEENKETISTAVLIVYVLRH